MIRKLKPFFKKFRKEEDGNMTVEFVLGIPLIFTLFLTSVEMGIFTVRQMFLDRGVELAVRNVRLNTGENLTHVDLRNMICNYAGFLDDCDTELSLSMNPIDIRTYGGPTRQPSDCNNSYQPLAPERNFSHGGEHQVMLIVACYKFNPVFPTTGLGYAMDSNGEKTMYGFTGFVQEPS